MDTESRRLFLRCLKAVDERLELTVNHHDFDGTDGSGDAVLIGIAEARGILNMLRADLIETPPGDDDVVPF